MTLRGLRCGSLSQMTQGSRNRGCLRCDFQSSTPRSPLLTYSGSRPNVRESNRALTTTAFMPRLLSGADSGCGGKLSHGESLPNADSIRILIVLWESLECCQEGGVRDLQLRLRHATSKCSPFITNPGTENDRVISNPGMDRVSIFTPTVGRIMWLYQISFPLRSITHEARQT